MKISRHDLYVKVWAIPIKHIAVEFKTNATTIHRACDRNEIPKPGRGHWRRMETGFSIQPAPLPDPANNYDILIPSEETRTVSVEHPVTRPAQALEESANTSASINIHEHRLVDVASGPNPIEFLRRLPDRDRRNQFLKALEDEVALRDPKIRAATHLWIAKARDAVVLLDMIETVLSAVDVD